MRKCVMQGARNFRLLATTSVGTISARSHNKSKIKTEEKQ